MLWIWKDAQIPGQYVRRTGKIHLGFPEYFISQITSYIGEVASGTLVFQIALEPVRTSHCDSSAVKWLCYAFREHQKYLGLSDLLSFFINLVPFGREMRRQVGESLAYLLLKAWKDSLREYRPVSFLLLSLCKFPPNCSCNESSPNYVVKQSERSQYCCPHYETSGTFTFPKHENLSYIFQLQKNK